jgi:outer membrane protein OmpA-like peptidoglycan-associated protein
VKLSAQGAGAARPVADNATREGRARNRRVELKVAAGG